MSASPAHCFPTNFAAALLHYILEALPLLCCREVAGGTNRVKQVLAAFRDAGAKLHQAQFLGQPGGCLRALVDVDAAVRRDPTAAVQVGRHTIHARTDVLPGALRPMLCSWISMLGVWFTSDTRLSRHSEFRILVSAASSTTGKTNKVVLKQSL